VQERDGTTCICSTSSELTLLSCSGIGRQTAAALAKRNAIGKEEEIFDSTATQACCGTGCCVTWLVNLKISQSRTVNQTDIHCNAVVLACRSAERGAKLLVALTTEAQAAGVASPQLEVS